MPVVLRHVPKRANSYADQYFIERIISQGNQIVHYITLIILHYLTGWILLTLNITLLYLCLIQAMEVMHIIWKQLVQVCVNNLI